MYEAIPKGGGIRRIAMITIENLTKRYGALLALDNLSFTVGRGEIVGLLGANGAGKSTTMNILTGYLAPTSGRVTVDGVDMGRNPTEAKRRIGYLPEQPPVYPDMTVSEYLSFVYELRGCTLPKEAHLAEILATARIREVASRLIRNLSKGYRQRVGIAAALVGDPPVLIFDEPTVGLDPKQIIEVRTLLRNLAKHHTVILSTHILSEVQAVCERIIMLDRGRLVADQPTEQLSRAVNDSARYLYRILGNPKEILAALRGKNGIAAIEALPPSGNEDGTEFLLTCQRGVDPRKIVFNACAAGGFPILGVSRAGGDLEEVFLRLLEQNGKKKG